MTVNSTFTSESVSEGHPDKMADLQRISGQGMTPTLKNGDFIVADFDIGEFEEALRQNPEEANKLGIQLD